MLVLVGDGTDLTLDGVGTTGDGIPIGDGTTGIGVGITGVITIRFGVVVFTAVGHTTLGDTTTHTDIMVAIMAITDTTATAVMHITQAAEVAITIKVLEVV